MKNTAVPEMLSWSLCVPTINRLDVLKMCVRCALASTIPPREISVVDASDDWERNFDEVGRLIGDSGVELHYQGAEVKSGCVQRNQAASKVTADIIFFFDDDTLMHPDCAETILRVYGADLYRRISAIAAVNVRQFPKASGLSTDRPTSEGMELRTIAPPRKSDTNGLVSTLRRNFGRWRFTRFIQREVLMMSMDRMFVPYDAHRNRRNDEIMADLSDPDLRQVRHLPGYGMTVRRDIATQEPFNPYLLAYCPTEDLEVSYRWGRHGANLIYSKAHVLHYEIASSRVTRVQATRLGILNSAFFIRLNSDARHRHIRHFYVLSVRRVIGEFLKDFLSRRFKFPQTRGAAEGVFGARQIFQRPDGDLVEWYVSLQRKILRK